MSTNNILPANGEPIIVPSQDVVLGLYYMTRANASMLWERAWSLQSGGGTGLTSRETYTCRLESRSGSMISISTGRANKVPVRKIVDTTIGRALLSEILPPGCLQSGQSEYGQALNIRAYQRCYRRVGLKETVIFADQ